MKTTYQSLPKLALLISFKDSLELRLQEADRSHMNVELSKSERCTSQVKNTRQSTAWLTGYIIWNTWQCQTIQSVRGTVVL
jgi:hypothetical protein